MCTFCTYEVKTITQQNLHKLRSHNTESTFLHQPVYYYNIWYSNLYCFDTADWARRTVLNISNI